MSDNLKLTTQEYVEKKLSAFTPGPSFKKIYEDDTSISIGANREDWSWSSKTDVMGYNEVGLYSGFDITGMWSNGLILADSKVTMSGWGGNYFEASYDKIKLGYDSGTSIFMDGPAYFSNDIYDKNGNKIGGYTHITEDSMSVYISGPVAFGAAIFDKNGQEITGGGGGSTSLPHIKDDADGTIFMAGPAVIKIPYDYSIQDDKNSALIFESEGGNVRGSIGFASDGPGGIHYFGISTPGVYSGGVSIYVSDYMGTVYIGLRIGDQDCHLSENDLRKLREILDAHS